MLGLSKSSNFRFHLKMVAGLCLLISLIAGAQEISGDAFDELSLKFRTALHHDPLLDSALDSLVTLYSNAERSEELIGLYRSHVEKYPDDAGAKSVLIQLLQSGNRDGVAELISSAVPLHGDFAPLQFLLFQFLEEKGDERAIDALARAINLEANPARRSEWFELLLRRSGQEKARLVAEEELKNLLNREDQAAEDLLSLARLMQRYQFWELSLDALGKSLAAGPGAEGEVEVEVQTARAQSELGQSEEAGRTLDGLIGRLAPDHWRRREIMSMRISVVATPEEREAILATLKEAYEAGPENEAAVLDYADMLIASERQSEAADLLVRSAAALPSSGLIETRAVELLLSVNDNESFEQFLETALEVNPERTDLRFYLVKVLYTLGKDADAEQDFRAVVAGLSTEEVSKKILELQRHLRLVDRADAAGTYLKQYIKANPNRLDVARELAELYLQDDDRNSAEEMVSALSPEDAESANVADLADYFIDEGLFGAARQILDRKLAVTPDDFELGILLIEVLGEVGDRTAAASQISLWREKSDTPPRYNKWLGASISANENLESLEPFLVSEQNRFSFSDGDWPAVKVEKFIILCEAGRQRLSTDKVTLLLSQQLDKAGLDSTLKVRLRRFLVELLGSDPAASPEIEAQLDALIAEDPGNVAEYRLRMGLLHHQSQRIDLAQELLAVVDWSKINSPNLVREGVEALLIYRFFPEAASALATLNRLEPDDVFSWSRRLSVLASMEDEEQFRTVTRSLRSGEAGVRLLPDSIADLTDHLVSSYWRSLSRLLAKSERISLQEVLPLLAAVEREIQSPEQRAWIEWTRLIVLAKLGLVPESEEATERFRKVVEEQGLKKVTFPDGLALLTEAALNFSAANQVGSQTPDQDPAFLMQEPALRWAFELDKGRQLIGFRRGAERILIIDDRGMIYGVDPVDGRLIWKKDGIKPGRSEFRGRPPFFNNSPLKNGLALSRNPGREIRISQSLAVEGGRFMLLDGDEVRCFSEKDGQLQWLAALPYEDRGVGATAVDAFDYIATGPGKVVVFRPLSQEAACFDSETGKLLWSNGPVEQAGNKGTDLSALNSGVNLSGGFIFLYGIETTILDANSGNVLWRFEPDSFTTFPVRLRKDRGSSESETIATLESAGDESWKTKTAENGVSVRAMDFFDSEEVMSASLFENAGETGGFVSPVMHWSYSRSFGGGPAMGILSGEYLWLAQSDRLRRISSQVPLGATELEVSGAFLGENGNHVWFLGEGQLNHADFYRDTVSHLDVSDLGPSDSVKAAFCGNQLVASGPVGFKIVNTLTGKIVGQSNWPVSVQDYLNTIELDSSDDEVQSILIWQGRIIRSGDQASPYCRSVLDHLQLDEYISMIDNRILICLGKSQAKETNVE